MSEKYWYLKRCRLFEQLTPEQLQRVEARSLARRVAPEVPCTPQPTPPTACSLASGRVKISSLTRDGKQSILAFIEPGELFGELAVVEPGQREEYAEAVKASLVILIQADDMLRLMEEHPDVSLRVTKLIGLRRKRFERRLKHLLFHSNRQRLVHLLLELAQDYGRPSPEGVELGIGLSHQDLANIIGSTRETVTVTLGQLQAEGSLRLGRRKITLTNLQGLAQSVRTLGPEPGRPDAEGKG